MWGIQRAGVCCKNVQTHNSTDVSLCVKCICQHSACLHPRLACQSVSQCMCKKRPSLLCVGCRHLSVNSSHFLSLFLCLPLCQTDSRKCLLKERSQRSRLKGSPQREAKSPSISVGICDCRRTDKMPSGQRCVLQQTEIWRALMNAVEKLYLEQTQPC